MSCRLLIATTDTGVISTVLAEASGLDVAAPGSEYKLGITGLDAVKQQGEAEPLDGRV